eukprot:244163_1
MPARKSQFQLWHEQVKRELLITEPQNILARAECCKNIINECISHMNMNLGLRTLSTMEQYTCKVIATDHLKYLLNWPGLRVDNSPKAPKSKKEYEKKSKNWLNGRRAPNYGKTLFPYFITDCERYVNEMSKSIITNNDEKRKLYYDIIMYKVLAQLCGCSVSLHEQAKKAPFFCKNSVERKGRLKEMLQSYAPDHEYIQGFPSCFEEAIGYFDRRSNEYFHTYRKRYLGYTSTCKSMSYNDDMDSLSVHDYNKKRSIKTVSKTSSNFKSYRLNKIHSYKKEELYGQNCNNMNNNMNNNAGGFINVDAEYWKKQFLNLKRELSNERQIRMNVERERDNLKTLINTSSDTSRINLSLRNDNSYDSSISTCSSHHSIPPNINHNINNNSFMNMNMSNINRYPIPVIHNNNIYQNNDMTMNRMNTMNMNNGSFVIPHNRPQHMNNNNNNNNDDAEYWKKQFLNIKRELIAERRMRKNAEIERDNLKNLINTSTDNMTPKEPIKPPPPSNNMMDNNINNCTKNMNMSNVQRQCINNNHLSLHNDISHRSMQSIHSMDTVSTACGSVCNVANNMPSNINNIHNYNHSQSCVHLNNINNINNTYVPTISNTHQTSFNNFYSNDMNNL